MASQPARSRSSLDPAESAPANGGVTHGRWGCWPYWDTKSPRWCHGEPACRRTQSGTGCSGGVTSLSRGFRRSCLAQRARLRLFFGIFKRVWRAQRPNPARIHEHASPVRRDITGNTAPVDVRRVALACRIRRVDIGSSVVPANDQRHRGRDVENQSQSSRQRVETAEGASSQSTTPQSGNRSVTGHGTEGQTGECRAVPLSRQIGLPHAGVSVPDSEQTPRTRQAFELVLATIHEMEI